MSVEASELIFQDMLSCIESALGNCYERYKSVLLLPGGTRHQLDTIDTIVNQLSQEAPTVWEFESWIIERWVCRPVTANYSRYILERANVIRRTPTRIVKLTVDGEKYLATGDTILLVKAFFDAYWGFWELVRIAVAATATPRRPLI